MTTNRIFLIVAITGVLLIIGAAMIFQHQRGQEEALKAAQAGERERDATRKRLEQQRDAILDAGPPARYYGHPRPDAACHCEPGDPLCACF